MSPMSIILVLTMSWMMIIFVILPIGVKVSLTPQRGHADSAPENPDLAKKTIISFILASIFTCIYCYIAYNYSEVGNYIIGK